MTESFFEAKLLVDRLIRIKFSNRAAINNSLALDDDDDCQLFYTASFEAISFELDIKNARILKDCGRRKFKAEDLFRRGRNYVRNAPAVKLNVNSSIL